MSRGRSLSVNKPTTRSRSASAASTNTLYLESQRHSFASTIGNITLSENQQSLEEYQEKSWPLQYWHYAEDGNEKAKTFPRHPYESYLDFLTVRWPHLAELRNWMSSSSPQKPRQYKLATTVLDFREKAAPIRREFMDDTGTTKDTGVAYGHLAACLKRATPASVLGRVIVVPYLQPSLVNCLGSAFDIDPDFFHGHLNMDGGNANAVLPSDPFIRLPYLCNTGRWGKVGEQRISIFVSTPSEEESHWTAIILLNTPDTPPEAISIESSTPPKGCRNLSKRHKFSRGPKPPQDLCNEYIQTVLEQSSDEHQFYARDPFYAMHFWFSLVIREWGMTISLLEQRRQTLEKDILGHGRKGSMISMEDEGEELSHKDPLRKLRNLRRTLTFYETTLSNLHEIVETGGKPEWRALKSPAKTSKDRYNKAAVTATSLDRDYSKVLSQTREIIKETDSAMSLLTTRWSVLLSQKGLEQNKISVRQAENIASLTWLVLVLLPALVVFELFSTNFEVLKSVMKTGWLLPVFAGGFVVLVVMGFVSSWAVKRALERRRSRRRVEMAMQWDLEVGSVEDVGESERWEGLSKDFKF